MKVIATWREPVTITTDGSPVHNEEDFVREHRRNRGLLVAVVVLAAAVVALVGWIVYDQTNSTVDAEVQQLLDDHREAWMTGDVEALRAITTDAYSYDEVVYINDPFDGFKLNFKYTGDFDDAVADLERGGNTITRGEVARWTIEQVGDPIVRTDGPARLVSVNETWVTGALHALAQSQYVLVEEDGQLKISYWYFANITDYPDS